ncbi:hypothetical protein [Bacillus methanolicus]|uniref:Uncharacterized protein n=1 Tax=Bacillus methanolicus (strain MGA3 / ATCC 53907) TaxID=796606 RepID=I3EBS9_BACMM|nr:hypothetical protein [Bacillus methanolicus]AIE61631.1 hypothetical protein BMMGA3_16390 [Bacillus methanolicus MGA3]EIJ83950.1 hypothetical protein MGA3_01620 [Bacillus methanolicus MGA3]
MSKSASNGIKRGQTIAFRIPSDTPDHIVKQLQKLKETEKRNFSSKIAEFVIQGVSQSLSKERETISIPLPQKLNKVQRDWLKHEHSEALLGSIIYQLISDPVRSVSLLAALNSKATDIDQALYLQEEEPMPDFEFDEQSVLSSDKPKKQSLTESNEKNTQKNLNEMEDDLANIDWESINSQSGIEDEKEEEGNDLDTLLGEFLNQMNK